MPFRSLFSLFAYAAFGFPLALVALPVYVYVPQFYVQRYGMSLGLIGAALLVSRLADACFDPWIGAQIDRRAAGHGFGRYIVIGLPFLAGGFFALFHPPEVSIGLVYVWFFASLLLVYAGLSLASIAFQSWGAALTQAPGLRLRLTAAREFCGLFGVICAAGLAQLGDIDWLSAVFLLSLGLTAALLLRYTPTISNDQRAQAASLTWSQLLGGRSFRVLLTVFIINGIAAAIPATLFLFFTKDKLQLGAYAGYLLLAYFLAAALSMPLWLRAAALWGEQRTWLIAMLASVASFIWVYGLQAGDLTGFVVICLISGMSLGADLALPPALLAALIHRAGHSGRYEGSYFGAWNWAAKMNLALAAGISLPLLDYFGYRPDSMVPAALQILTLGYALLPCLLKGIAAAILWRIPLHPVRE
ncbi:MULTISPECIES: MFS transporter [unclassified Undibacterium]|uniref:MFS transporter n=1 Tax=unclassified Undibacterium TaxID=2630295 RepID=UPI002AC89F94|nr:MULTISPECIES: MFS transporter [unclassified Undibacterium]MEB0139524.1 MFS transporter [Undibacterium sp. CCC2.1]MEB0172367.1 MFS transporter [Undibacterium sp. CCC1.1]MEB0175694.1 MFS transporter [Undibacterium sp. CCC3.4]MEB0214482.1 MFS transporter [Undibacterium sp. 5I2]WPX42879.1 MFS transporter [Undibacterium sp. CCC3.4]